MSNKKKFITLFLSKFDTFEVSFSGINIYSKTSGVKHFGGEVSFAPDDSKRYVSINLIDENRNEKIVKKIYFGTGENSWLILADGPIISSDGSSIAFIECIRKYDRYGRSIAKKYKIHVIQGK